MAESYDAVLFDLFGTLVTERGEAVVGAARILGGLPPDRWAIVTSCPRRLAEALLRRSGLPVPRVVVSSDDVAISKPAPDCYLLAAERIESEPDRCLVIEDSRHGIEAGEAAGMTVVGIGREIRVLQDLALEVEPGGTLRLRR